MNPPDVLTYSYVSTTYNRIEKVLSTFDINPKSEADVKMIKKVIASICEWYGVPKFKNLEFSEEETGKYMAGSTEADAAALYDFETSTIIIYRDYYNMYILLHELNHYVRHMRGKENGEKRTIHDINFKKDLIRSYNVVKPYLQTLFYGKLPEAKL